MRRFVDNIGTGSNMRSVGKHIQINRDTAHSKEQYMRLRLMYLDICGKCNYRHNYDGDILNKSKKSDHQDLEAYIVFVGEPNSGNI